MLQRCRWDVRLGRGRAFLGGWNRGDAARAAVVAHLGHHGIASRRLAVGVVNDARVEVVYRPVVSECIPRPAPSRESDAGIAEAVVDTAIVADVRTPIPGMEHIHRSGEAPVAGSPKDPRSRRPHPRSRHPVITAATPSPIRWSPKQAIIRAGWLGIILQGRGDLGRPHFGVRRRGWVAVISFLVAPRQRVERTAPSCLDIAHGPPADQDVDQSLARYLTLVRHVGTEAVP